MSDEDTSPIQFTLGDGSADFRYAVVVPWVGGIADTLMLDAGGHISTTSGDLDGELGLLRAAGFARDDEAAIPSELARAVRDHVHAQEDVSMPGYRHGPTWSLHAARRARKGTGRPPVRGSERAWVGRAWPHSWERGHHENHSYLEFVRYMRWYARRSYLMRKIAGSVRAPGRQEFHAEWPRWTP